MRSMYADNASFFLKLGLVLAVLAVFLLRGGDRDVGETLPALQERIPSTAASYGAVQDECDGKDRCLVVYLAPWCGACRGSKGFLQALDAFFSQQGSYGLKVVVGRDSRDSIDEFARSIPLNVYLDYERRWSQAFGSSVPAWVWLDGEGRLLKRDAGLYNAAAADLHIAAHFVKQLNG